MKIYCQAEPDLKKARVHPLLRILQILIMLWLSSRLYFLIRSLIWLMEQHYPASFHFWVTLAVYTGLMVLDIIWMVRPHLKDNSLLVSHTPADTEFFHQGGGSQYKYHVVLIHNGVLYKGQPADIRFLLPLGDSCRMTYSENEGKLSISGFSCLRLIERDGMVLKSQKTKRYTLSFYVTEEQAIQIGRELDGNIRGLHGSDKVVHLSYPVPIPGAEPSLSTIVPGREADAGYGSGSRPAAASKSSSDSEPAIHLTGDPHKWSENASPVYKHAVETNWCFQAMKLTEYIYIPLSIVAVVLEIILTDYFSGGDVHPNYAAMFIFLAIQAAIIPVLLKFYGRRVPMGKFLTSLEISSHGVYGTFFSTQVRDDDNTEEENIRGMTSRTTLQIPFVSLTDLEYDPERHNLRFTGPCTVRTDNALSDAGKEQPKVRQYDHYVINDCFQPSLVEKLRERGWSMRISRIELEFPDAGRGIIAMADAIFIFLMFLPAEYQFTWSQFSPVIAIILMHVIAQIKKKRQKKNPEAFFH